MTRTLIPFFAFLLSSLFPLLSLAEGTKQLCPDSISSAARLYFAGANVTNYTNFAVAGCPSNYRLNIHVKNPGESILMGFSTFYSNVQFTLRKPNGSIALTGTLPYLPSHLGYLLYFKQALVGPFPTHGGYNPIEYKVTNSADTGNYYFEIANLSPYATFEIEKFDFQVVSGAHTPHQPQDTINGRVWSQSWQFYAYLSYPYEPFNGKFHVYSDDGIVTKLQFSNAHVGAVTIFCNKYGCLSTGNFTTDRQSMNLNTFTSFPGIAQYKVFLNNPDSTLYPSGQYGQIVGTPDMIPDPNFPVCSGKKQIVVNVDKSGTVEVGLTFPYGGTATMVSLYSPVTAGINYIPWDGNDGLSNPVPDGTLITGNVKYVNGLTNLPIWDQEANPDGFIISLVRPISTSGQIPPVYWDDSQLTGSGGGSGPCAYPPQTTNLTGCTPGSIVGYAGCHPWNNNLPDCHDKMINTWWYGSTSNAPFTEYHSSTPQAPVGQGANHCGPGAVTLHAIPSPASTIDWYDTIAGGTPLLTGNTTFITPLLYVSTTYYAEARSDSSSCTSTLRTPVIAHILPAPSPTISGNTTPCISNNGLLYTTETGMMNYDWSVSPGGVIVNGQGTDQVTVLWVVPGNLWISVNYSDSSGCYGQQPFRLPVSAATVPANAGEVSGVTPVCAGTQNVGYSVAPIQGAFLYEWNLPYGAHLAGGAGTNSILVDFDTIANSGFISVHGGNHCGIGAESPAFGVTVNHTAVTWAGPDVELCQGTQYTIQAAAASNFSTLLWTHNGNGTLINQNTLIPTYIPATEETGYVTLTLHAMPLAPCSGDSSSMQIHYLPRPVVAAGNDQHSCSVDPVLITGSNATGFSSLLWSTSGDGSFSDTTALHPTYSPGTNDLSTGAVQLTLTGTGVPPCETETSQKSLTFSQTPVVFAGNDSSICEGNQYTLTEASATNYQTVYWSTSGDGYFSDRYNLSSVYVPGEKDNLAGYAWLYLTAYASEPCPPSADSLRLTISPAPRAYAGVDDTICQGGSYYVTGTSAENYSSILWTHNGQGTLTGETTLTPTYIATPNETGYSNLKMSVYGKENCSEIVATDKRRIIINQTVVANAGPDLEIPYDTSIIIIGNAEGGSGEYHYSWTPSQFLTDSDTEHPKTIHLLNDQTFAFFVTDLFTGCSSSDEVFIQVNPKKPDDSVECLNIYNVITPNGDAVNDTWIIDCIESYPENRVEIFDRWGNIIRTFDHYDNTTVVWKGTNRNDETVPDGTYYYLLTLKNGNVYKGWVLVR